MKLFLILSFVVVSFAQAMTCEGYFKELQVRTSLGRFSFGSEGIVLQSSSQKKIRQIGRDIIKLIGEARRGSTVRIITPFMSASFNEKGAPAEYSNFHALLLYKMILETYKNRDLKFDMYLGSRKESKTFAKFLTESPNFNSRYAIRNDFRAGEHISSIFQVIVETESGIKVLRFEMKKGHSETGLQVLEGQYVSNLRELSEKLNSLYTYQLFRPEEGIALKSAWIVERLAAVMARDIYQDVFNKQPDINASATSLIQAISSNE